MFSFTRFNLDTFLHCPQLGKFCTVIVVSCPSLSFSSLFAKTYSQFGAAAENLHSTAFCQIAIRKERKMFLARLDFFALRSLLLKNRSFLFREAFDRTQKWVSFLCSFGARSFPAWLRFCTAHRPKKGFSWFCKFATSFTLPFSQSLDKIAVQNFLHVFCKRGIPKFARPLSFCKLSTGLQNANTFESKLLLISVLVNVYWFARFLTLIWFWNCYGMNLLRLRKKKLSVGCHAGSSLTWLKTNYLVS